MAASKDFTIRQGATFSSVLRWEASPIVYRPITAITQSAPVRITCPSHNVPQDWRVAIVSVRGMTQINASSTPPKDRDFHRVTVVDADTLELNAVNSADFRPYTAGGYVMYNTPVDLSGFTARMSVKDKVGGTELFRLDTTNGRIVLDNAAKTITLTIASVDTAAIAWTKGVYDLELVSGGVVETLLSGRINVVREVTTT